MQLTYDPRHNIAYLRLQEKTAEVETIRISDALNVDLAPDGTVYGIELLNANEQLRVGRFLSRDSLPQRDMPAETVPRRSWTRSPASRTGRGASVTRCRRPRSRGAARYGWTVTQIVT
jgi:uncharacterized protein YuzE